jgi:hypothetical protein
MEKEEHHESEIVAIRWANGSRFRFVCHGSRSIIGG